MTQGGGNDEEPGNDERNRWKIENQRDKIVWAMGKKRRTKEQKIIARLRRELGKRNATSVKTETTIWDRKAANTITQNATENLEKSVNKKVSEKLLLSYEPELIKKDIRRSLILSLFFVGLIAILKLAFHF
ncbi:MAG TPA: hypothetical protein VMW29_00875 [Candidatus Bathyarchaeia archaeon]|nr:hypothetical protein [Candidatus Bathyarchaeia archaeon]